MSTEPKMFYFGPWEHAGHHLFTQHGSHVRPNDRGSFPWNEDSNNIGIDGQLQPGCRREGGFWRGPDQVEGHALLHHKSGWTAISFWDRSVDTRMGCNSTYFAEGNFTFDEMVAMAKVRFKKRWDKMSFNVVLVKAEAQNG